MYKEHKKLNLPQVDKDILTQWEEKNIFEKSISEREGAETFVFYEGPPSANGKPGIHHVMARTVKDLFCRYQTMLGKKVERKGGWDTHGLPVELSVEKELGITKEDIGTKISVEEYNVACRKTVMRYKSIWDNLTVKMGYWVDLDAPYVTFENNYIESVWHNLRTIYDKNLLYKGYTIQPYSPAAGTGLSSHELNMPGAYQNVTDTTIVAQFKLTEPEKVAEGIEDIFALAWTTTPWTLPSNTALTVGKKIDYVLVKTFNQYTAEPMHVILAKNLVGKQFGKKYTEVTEDQAFVDYKAGDKKIPFRIEQHMKGADLVGVRYEQLLPWALPNDNPENAFQIIEADFVTTEDGTGIVHTAPTFGADDAMAAKKYDVPALLIKNEDNQLVPLVDLKGRFIEQIPAPYGGKYIKNEYYDEGTAPEKSMDVEIAILLKTQNRAFHVEKYVHSYPHCWRTDKPVLYYPLDSWFIRISEVKERMVELNKTINWKPRATGEGRFGKWLENANDWNLSRSRFWGIPLPIWRTEDKKEEVCIGSVAELAEAIKNANEKLGLNQEVPADLHKPYIDRVTLVSPSGKEMKRESDLIDVWFDSGSMPNAQWHYPFENEDKFKGAFPADFISEGVDQTRGWFYTLHAIGTMTQDSVAFKNVLSTGLVLDKDGKKMSKRLGNAVDPFSTLNEQGADATRWYMLTNANPWDNLKFDIAGLEEVRRKFFGTLYNTYSFFALYANIDKYEVSDLMPLSERPEIDRWIISLLNSLKAEVKKDYAEYEPTRAGRKIQQFVEDHLSNWYVRLCRRRFWKGELSNDKKAAYQTLHTCLKVVSQLMAPLAPFYSDQLYGDLTQNKEKESVHLSLFPAIETDSIDKDLEERMSYAQRVSSMVLSLRKREKIRVRQPLQKILIPILNPKFKTQFEQVKELVLAEVNVKEVDYLEDSSTLIKKKAKPNFKTLGRKLGKNMKAAAGIIAAFSNQEINEIEKNGSFELTIDEQKFELTTEDIEILTEDIPGWMLATDAELTVALDVTITEELEAEGIARELVNRIQNVRKSSDFKVTDKINIQLATHVSIEKAVESHLNYICNEVLAESLTLENAIDSDTQIDILGQDLNIKMSIHES